MFKNIIGIFKRNKGTLALSLPIFAEQIFSIILSYFSQYILTDDQILLNAIVQSLLLDNIIIIAANVFGIGSIVMLSQFDGAKDKRGDRVYAMSFYSNIFLGALISLLKMYGSDTLFTWMRVDSQVIGLADEYMFYTGIFIVFQFIDTTFASFLRAKKLNKELSIITLIMSIVNVLAQALFFLVLKMGVLGLALAVSLSRIIGAILYIWVYYKKIRISLSPKMLIPADWETYWKTLKTGLYSVVENFSYNLTYIFLMSFINGYGVMQGNINGFISTITVADCLFVNALIQETQIEEGIYIGEGNNDEADRLVKDTIVMSLAWDLFFSLLLIAIGYPLFLVLMRTSADPQEAAILGLEVLAVDFFLEIGRVIASVLVRSLQVAGDGMFVMVFDIPISWLTNVGLSYLFGNVCGWGLLGAWCGITMDVVIRAIALDIRWRKGDWRKKNLVSQKLA
jgi:Na+-driven multidrug efflux pump